jgi:hypothetical protein
MMTTTATATATRMATGALWECIYIYIYIYIYMYVCMYVWVCVAILGQAVSISNTGRSWFACPHFAAMAVESVTEEGIAEVCKLIKEQVGAIEDCEVLVQTLWDKFKAKERTPWRCRCP